MNETSPKHTAVAPLVGYLYQLQMALLTTLQKKQIDNFDIYIERDDDFSIETSDSTDVVQVKHSNSSREQLTNYSHMFWKTLYNWIQINNSKDASTYSYTLLLTYKIADDSNLKKLSYENVRALSKNIPNKIISKDLLMYIKVFNDLPEEKQKHLIDHITICENMPKSKDMRLAIAKELSIFYTDAEPDLPFCSELQNWWLGEILKRVNKETHEPIKREQVQITLQRLIRKYTPLKPIYDTKDIDKTKYDEYVFIKQLGIIFDDEKTEKEVKENTYSTAIENFYWSYKHKEEWLKNAKSTDVEINEYENAVNDKWTTLNQEIRHDYSIEDSNKGIKLYFKCINNPAHKFRDLNDNYNDRMYKGTLHTLADSQKIGWHPKYKKLLEDYYEKSAKLE